jgi:hypothetical protein
MPMTQGVALGYIISGLRPDLKPPALLLCEVATLLCKARYAGQKRERRFATKHEQACR